MPPRRISARGFTASVLALNRFSWSNSPSPSVASEGGRGRSSAFSTIEMLAGPQNAGFTWVTNSSTSGAKSARASASKSSAEPSSDDSAISVAGSGRVSADAGATGARSRATAVSQARIRLSARFSMRS